MDPADAPQGVTVAFAGCHTGFAAVIVVTSVVHALLIEGTMGTVSKVALCALVLAAAGKVMADLRSWAVPVRRRA